jgi:signal transduction histidine kinase
VIDHSGSDNYSEVKKHVDALLKSKNEIKSGIRNIYFNKYSYVYKNGSYLVVIDMTNARNELIKELIQSLIIFVLLEIIIFFIVKVLTRWITKPAVESFKNQKEFIADASHELKTPIAIIMASADEIGETKTNKQYLQNIKDETEKMNQLVTNLLTLSKLDSNVETLFEVIDISKIINKNSLKFESIAFENKVKIKTNIEDNILFNCNNLEINQLVSILLDNAIEHSYENSTIEVNLSSDKKNIYLEVINKGDVISDKDIEKIFDRFYRSDKSRNRNTNHYGLGLSIAKNIVIKHNGTINVTSKDDKTCFKIIFKK